LSAQEELFARETLALAIDDSFTTAKRIALDGRSWVDVVPGWVSGSRILLDRLTTAVPWRQHDRRMFDQVFREPRLTAQYRSLHRVPEKALLDAVGALSGHYGVAYDSLWLNLYRDGQDSTGWHRDRFSCQRTECVVPVLTLGATRRFLIKPRHRLSRGQHVLQMGTKRLLGFEAADRHSSIVRDPPAELEGRGAGSAELRRPPATARTAWTNGSLLLVEPSISVFDASWKKSSR
jgi:alkylated DNA repair dioxygenase AlkB